MVSRLTPFNVCISPWRSFFAVLIAAFLCFFGGTFLVQDQDPSFIFLLILPFALFSIPALFHNLFLYCQGCKILSSSCALNLQTSSLTLMRPNPAKKSWMHAWKPWEGLEMVLLHFFLCTKLFAYHHLRDWLSCFWFLFLSAMSILSFVRAPTPSMRHMLLFLFSPSYPSKKALLTSPRPRPPSPSLSFICPNSLGDSWFFLFTKQPVWSHFLLIQQTKTSRQIVRRSTKPHRNIPN